MHQPPTALIVNARTFGQIAPVALPVKRIEFDAELQEYAVYCGDQFITYTNTRDQAEQKWIDHLARTSPRLRGM